uniref:Peptidase_M13_N domain-containing protein n=1 Tax=Ascaris lumbricoides TaxID=6252 RepID=A0A0M3IL54_ASCLU
MAAQKIAMPELDFYEGALAEIGNWPFIEKRAGARSFPVLEDLLEKRRIYDAFSSVVRAIILNETWNGGRANYKKR